MIARLHAPSQSEFDAHIDRKLPFLVTGVIDRWPARTRWTTERLQDALRDKVLYPQVFASDDYFDTWTRHGWPLHAEVEGARLVELIERPEDARRYYLWAGIRGLGGGLFADVEIPELVLRNGRGHELDELNIAFMYSQGSATPLHYHPLAHVALCVVRGRKRVKFYAPEISRRFYVRSIFEPYYNHSDVNFHHLERYPRFRSVEPAFDVAVEGGELLYLPPQWWHVVFTEGTTASVQVVWQSQRKHWTLGGRGLRARVHRSQKLRDWQQLVSGRLAKLRGMRPDGEAWMGTPERIAWRARHNAAVEAARAAQSAP